MICTLTGLFASDLLSQHSSINSCFTEKPRLCYEFIVLLSMIAPILLLGALPILIIQFKKCFCCNCCCNLQTNMTFIDVYQTDKLIPLEQINDDQNTNEMEGVVSISKI